MSQVIVAEDLFSLLQKYERRLDRLEHAALYDVPIGAVLMYPGYFSPNPNTTEGGIAPLPFGFLRANGDAVSRTEFEALFNRLSLKSTGTWTTGSQTISGIPQAYALQSNGIYVNGVGIPVGTRVTARPSVTSLTVDKVFTDNGSNSSLAFMPYGDGNGTTTFNLPQIANHVTGNGSQSGWIIRAR